MGRLLSLGHVTRKSRAGNTSLDELLAAREQTSILAMAPRPLCRLSNQASVQAAPHTGTDLAGHHRQVAQTVAACRGFHPPSDGKGYGAIVGPAYFGEKAGTDRGTDHGA